MGVTGLWKLIEPCGKPVPVETLEGKVLAVDISIWLHQVVKGFQDNKGSALNNAHLLGLFHRLCKLLYYRVRPVFVFDGCVPQLKKDTIARRQQQRSKLNNEADRIQALLLESLAKEKLVQQALGTNAELLFKRPLPGGKRQEDPDDMFKLPELPSTSAAALARKDDDQEYDSEFNDSGWTSFDAEGNSSSTVTEDSSFDESNLRNSYNANLQAIDVKSQHFRNLPADVRHEILVDIKETRKQSSWGRLHELPSRGDDFSVFQMRRLLKRRAVQESLEEAEQEMGGRTLTYAELNNLFTEEGIVEPSAMAVGSKQICSDENTRFLLVRDLKKKLAKKEEEKEAVTPVKDEAGEKEPKREDVTAEPKEKVEEESSSSKDSLGTDYESDLQMAIALSLEESTVYSEKDYEYENQLKLNKNQRENLQNAAKGPARAYMIEYGGMNEEEVAGIMEQTQVDEEDEEAVIKRILDESSPEKIKANKEQENKGEKEKPKGSQEVESSQEIRLHVSDDDSDTDSDLQEVVHKDHAAEAATPRLEIVLNLDEKLPPEEDLFADVFSKKPETTIKADSESDSDLEEVVEEGEPLAGKVEHEQVKVEPLRNFGLEQVTVEENKAEITLKKDAETSSVQPASTQTDNNSKVQEILQAVKHEKEDTQQSTIEVPRAEILDESQNDKEIIREGVESEESQTKQINLEKVEDSRTTKTPSSSDNLQAILEDIKKKTREIHNLKLENVHVDNTILEISDDEHDPPKQPEGCKTPEPKPVEVIDLDSDKEEKNAELIEEIISSPRTPTDKKSPKQKTPSKNASITEFFQVEYVVKRTPEKIKQEEDTEPPAKVKSPFFVRKTPKSQKSAEKSATPSPGARGNQTPSKATKSLFAEAGKQVADDADEGITPLAASQPLNEEEVLREAAQVLKDNKSEEELKAMASGFAKERQDLEAERNRQNRMGMGISQRMSSECQELLRLFGIPYIVAPMEAEAQCAFLDAVQLTNGTITDDSDIWLFGGRTVYKNFFSQNKHVMEFRAEEIEKNFQCDRYKLIQLACLVGSDYTTGIHGIGTVTALEILASFSQGSRQKVAENPPSISETLSTLSKFRDWWRARKAAAMPPGSSAKMALMKKLKNIELYEGFPSVAVVEAYLSPKIDENRDTFSWGEPDVESIREYARKIFGWTTLKTDEILRPVLKKLHEKRTQASIRNYFSVKSALSTKQPKVSKRVQMALDKMSGRLEEVDTPEKPPAKKPRARRAKGKVEAPVGESSEASSARPAAEEKNLPSTSHQAASPASKVARPAKNTRKRVGARIPNTKEVIPQRQKDLQAMEQNRAKAVELLKAAKQEQAAVKKKRTA